MTHIEAICEEHTPLAMGKLLSSECIFLMEKQQSKKAKCA